MSEFSNQYRARENKKERDNTRKEKLAGYFFDLSKLCFAGLVVGVAFPLFSNVYDLKLWVLASFGFILTVGCALMASKILK